MGERNGFVPRFVELVNSNSGPGGKMDPPRSLLILKPVVLHDSFLLCPTEIKREKYEKD